MEDRGLRMSCLLIFLANGSAECWSLHIFPGIVVDVGNPSASIPSGCHLVLFFDLSRTSKYQKAPSCEFGSDSAGSADPLGIWEGFGAGVP